METQQQNKHRHKIVVQSLFARKYLSYLVPALMKLKEKTSKNVKYEVDMAMVLSAQGFAWSNGLKSKLQRELYHDVDTKSSSIVENIEGSEDEEKLKKLIRLIPGGEKICDKHVVDEVESYIKCLQMQVNVLQCLLEETC